MSTSTGLLNICSTTPVCQAADTSVSQMDSVFQSADPNTQAQFQSAHDSIMQAYNNNSSWYTNYIPFNPTCCTLQSIGQQADALTAQIQTAMGQTPTVGASSSAAGLSLSNLLLLVGAGYLVLTYVGEKAARA